MELKLQWSVPTKLTPRSGFQLLFNFCFIFFLSFFFLVLFFSLISLLFLFIFNF